MDAPPGPEVHGQGRAAAEPAAPPGSPAARDEDSQSDACDEEPSRPGEDGTQDGAAKASEEGAKPGVKNAEALAREEALRANFAKHEHLSADELERTLPRRLDGTLASIGAVLHASNTCAPCSFFHFSMKGCHNGVRCRFCHAEHEKRQRRRTRHKKRAAEGALAEAERDRPAKGARTDHDRPKGQDISGIQLDAAGNSRPSWLQNDDDRASGGNAWFLPPCLSDARWPCASHRPCRPYIPAWCNGQPPAAGCPGYGWPPEAPAALEYPPSRANSYGWHPGWCHYGDPRAR